ncbi:4438_t:CDS:2 [Paraglomus occultum]|uniref:4438_t:CDS:1 n=1 Tax=Paraglomus occultum TaxID=144539 RepID=A0A9N8ZWA9_9GLOM|nr:4438_t:CDS:2 [Paraglomus occultum]
MSRSFRTTRRRSSVLEDDVTKTLLAAKTPTPISKRRGSAVSIESLQPSSRRNSIIMIDTPILATDFTNGQHKVLELTDTCEFISDFPAVLSLPSPPKSPDSENDEDIGTLSQHAHQRSLSVSSENPIPSIGKPTQKFDYHYAYKQKSKMSTRKLESFFGEKPPLDICMKEIEKEGLKAMLNSKIPLCYFMYSLLEEYSAENLFFLLEVEQYESFDYQCSNQQFATAQHIFITYLTPNSQFEVNVDDKRAVLALLEVSFAQFMRSNTADMMRRDIGEATTHYSPEARDNAILLLLRFLSRQSSPSSSHAASSVPTPASSAPSSPITSPTVAISQHRHQLVRTMVYEFVRALLDIDVEAYFSEGTRYRHSDRGESKGNSVDMGTCEEDMEPFGENGVWCAGANVKHRKSVKELNPFKKGHYRSGYGRK